jgi:hypothetical protein
LAERIQNNARPQTLDARFACLMIDGVSKTQRTWLEICSGTKVDYRVCNGTEVDYRVL